MKRTNIDEYRALMSDVELPDRVRDAVKREAARVRDAAERPAAREDASGGTTADARGRSGAALDHADPPPPAFRRDSGQRRRRSLAAAACLALAAVAIAGALALGPQAQQAGNSFALAAYAAEQGDGESSKGATTLELHDFGLMGGWGCGDLDLETGEAHNDGDAPGCVGDDGQAFAQVRYLLDLTCTGTNIESVTYAIGGERVHFTSENWVYGPNSDEPIDFEQQDRFTVAYDEQQTDKAKTQRNLVAYFPVNERGCEIHTLLSDDAEQLQRIHERSSSEDAGGGASSPLAREEHPELLSDAEVKALNDELDNIIQRGYADLLAQAPLTLTATFEDGTTQTKSYVIAPVADFEERLAAHRARQMEPFPASLFAPPEPALYTITEVSS